MGKGANVMIANGSESKWSVKLDDEESLQNKETV
ncbi:PTS system transporter subunit IIA [Vibrio cholerae]|nr:PTS system transporter subunit IIA [Vibrio cholerae]